MDPLEARTFTDLLDLDEFEVVDAVSDRKTKVRRLTVTPATAVGVCPHCRRWMTSIGIN